jgi:predicted dehydrogenase
LKLGIIGGYGKQGKKLADLLQANCSVEFIYYLHRDYSVNDKNTTGSIKDLLKCEGIIIASPNNTHFQYIKYFNEVNYFGYIFCEKPACNTLDELKYLSNISDSLKSRLLFGFNLRFDKYITNSFCISDLGKCLYITIISGHGLAYKKGYEKSWRNSQKKNKNGIIENVLIHYIDRFLSEFGNPSEMIYQKQRRGPVSVTYDTVHYSAIFNDNICLDVFISYAMPCLSNIKVIYENGLVEFGDEITISYPRDYFSENGNFVAPKIQKMIKKNIDEIWTESQNNIIKYFLEKLNGGQQFDLIHYDNSINSTKYLLNMTD